ncbi:hypothetical protein E2C01_095898 [Portunus trituberculatus]|uniref:Uncharacterized protein n=1 Tax=Portunus trituberculatus TaxID=210409 RepID=A0A5B7K1L6_PORTR|nr:hypothetical protein [Portunus trituberculatus]
MDISKGLEIRTRLSLTHHEPRDCCAVGVGDYKSVGRDPLDTREESPVSQAGEMQSCRLPSPPLLPVTTLAVHSSPAFPQRSPRALTPPSSPATTNT